MEGCVESLKTSVFFQAACSLLPLDCGCHLCKSRNHPRSSLLSYCGTCFVFDVHYAKSYIRICLTITSLGERNRPERG
jgi:hypothetical protein